MCERGWGRVVTISSGAGQTGLALGVSLYAAGKGAGISFMRHLAMEVDIHLFGVLWSRALVMLTFCVVSGLAHP